MNNLTTPTNTHTEGWLQMQSLLKPDGGEERLPFFPIKDVPSGGHATIEIIAGPFFENFHGGFSLVEFDVKDRSGSYRLCVSGSRLARAIAAIKPGIGDSITLTPTGEGKARTWAAKLG